MSQLRAEQQESARHLRRLSDVHANLEPLLSRLSALLGASRTAAGTGAPAQPGLRR
jgi:hypothetical protein